MPTAWRREACAVLGATHGGAGRVIVQGRQAEAHVGDRVEGAEQLGQPRPLLSAQASQVGAGTLASQICEVAID